MKPFAQITSTGGLQIAFVAILGTSKAIGTAKEQIRFQSKYFLAASNLARPFRSIIRTIECYIL